MADEKKKIPQMRAATTTERFGDKIRDGFESLTEQPLARLADALGLSDFSGIKNTFTTPDDGVKMGMMPGGPGKGLAGIIRDRGPSRLSGADQRFTSTVRDLEQKYGMRHGWGSQVDDSKRLGRPSTEIQGHPALPPEFNMTSSSRTGPIDMDNLPSGKIEYLDPDVAEYMNPKSPIRGDYTSPDAQRKLRFLTGK